MVRQSQRPGLKIEYAVLSINQRLKMGDYGLRPRVRFGTILSRSY